VKSKVSAIYKETVQQLNGIYEENESKAIANILFEDLLGLSRSSRLSNMDSSLNKSQLEQWKEALVRLLNHEPIQQVVGFCHFYGLKFFVNKHALTPRPETEELVDLIIQENQRKGLSVLDIGTGTGCIAIALCRNLENVDVTSWDIAEESIALAKGNATLNHTEVKIERKDILLAEPTNYSFDIIVSNPPYIPENERTLMRKNVLQYEPFEALFVPNRDPLLFYRSIAEFGVNTLKKAGKLYFEIHEDFGKEVNSLLDQCGYKQITVIRDMQGKDRIIRATI
jgi:release factor glutamine methyltransferase